MRTFMTKEEKAAYQNGIRIFRDLSDMLNSMSYDEQASIGFLDAAMRDHPCLQGKGLKLALAYLARMATVVPDGRNQFEVAGAKEVVKAYEEAFGGIYDPDGTIYSEH